MYQFLVLTSVLMPLQTAGKRAESPSSTACPHQTDTVRKTRTRESPRRSWRLRRLLEGCRRNQGRTGARRCAARRPPAAMHYGVRMIAQELEVSLHMAFVEARQQRHEFITVEHLLMALLDNPSAAEVLRACSANLDDLGRAFPLIKEPPTVGAPTRSTPSHARLPSRPSSARILPWHRPVRQEVSYVSNVRLSSSARRTRTPSTTCTSRA